MLLKIRYTLTQPEAVQNRFQTRNPLRGKPQYHIYPGMKAPFVYAHRDGFNALHQGVFGFVPPWDSDSTPNAYLNAGSENILDKVTFRDAFATSRCLVIADGFYVWDETQPYYVRLRSRQLFGIAGIFGRNTYHQPPLDSFALLTTFPNLLVAEVHHRMSVIIRPEHEAYYLDPSTPLQDVQSLLLPYEDEDMEMYPVSPRLNAAKDNSRDYIRPLTDHQEKLHLDTNQKTEQLPFF